MASTSPPRRLARLAALAVVGVVAYGLVDAALRFLEPQYSLLRSAESDYGNGAFAWLMDANFLLRGILSLAAATAIAALARPTGTLRLGVGLIVVWAIGSGLLAFFPDDLAGTAATAAGRIHLLLALVAFVAVSVGAVVAAYALRHEPSWRPVVPFLLGLAVVGLLALPLVARPPLRGDVGLFERLFLALELGWLLVASAWAWRVATHEVPERAVDRG